MNQSINQSIFIIRTNNNNRFQYMGWQWRNFFKPYLCQLFSRHDVGQALRNVCYCDITFLVRYGHFLKPTYLILFEWCDKSSTSQSTPCCPKAQRSLCDHRLLWRHFTLYTLCLKKRPTFTTCYIIFTYTVRLRQFLAQMLPRKQTIKMYFIFAPHLLLHYLGKQETRKLRLFS